MKIAKYVLFICIIGILQPYAQGGQKRLDITLHGKGTVIEKEGIEQIHAEGTAKGDISGTFVWEEEHQPAFELGKAAERGTITITDKNGDRLVLDFFGKTKKQDIEDSGLEAAEGGFTYCEGSGHWANTNLEGTYSKAGHFQGDSVELTVSLEAEVK